MPRMHKVASAVTLEPDCLRESPGPTTSSLDVALSNLPGLFLFPDLPSEAIIIPTSCILKVVERTA